MPKFQKEIVRSGFYVVNSDKGKKVQLITPERLNHWSSQMEKMREAGLDITAPAMHTKKAVPEDRQDPARWSHSDEGSKSNYGFWESPSITDSQSDSGNPVKALSAVIDVPLQKDAEKVGNTVKSTSVCVVPEFIDGKGRIWKDVITHIYVGNDTIEPNQKNFKELGNAEIISMSNYWEMNAATNQELAQHLLETDYGNPATEQVTRTGDDLVQLLASVAGVYIPRGTSAAELPEALQLALKQKELSEQNRDGGTVDKPPKDAYLTQVPVVMSNNQNTQNPAQTNPNPVEVSPEIILSHPEFIKQQQQTQGLLMSATNGKKDELTRRLTALRQRGIVTDEQLKVFKENVDQITMSFDSDNNPVPSPIEYQIQALEAVQIPMPPNTPMTLMANQQEGGDYIIQGQQPHAATQMTAERADEIADALLGQTTV